MVTFQHRSSERIWKACLTSQAYAYLDEISWGEVNWAVLHDDEQEMGEVVMVGENQTGFRRVYLASSFVY